jgi:GNAT superfamily N-acetyltransferase
MPTALRKIPFSAALLPAVQGFDCGDRPWEREVSAWIRNDGIDGVLVDMEQRGTDVWLYATDDGNLIGFGSLGASAWNYPKPSSERIILNLIPYLGIQRRFQGQPIGAPRSERYAAQILDHLIFEASSHIERAPILALKVHRDNVRAIRAYETAGFRHFPEKRSDFAVGKQIYCRMTLDLLLG